MQSSPALRLTDRAIAYIARWREKSPKCEWSISISWHDGEWDNRRTPSGGTDWVKGRSAGWIAYEVPASNGVSTSIQEVAGIKVHVQDTEQRRFPGGIIDSDGHALKVETAAI